ncbi:hypothetical protein M1394_00610 [Candidatus Marsarchaeota archaeon]|nr:hypothetical protein [Candidatus Marsarchaeota archaeon]
MANMFANNSRSREAINELINARRTVVPKLEGSFGGHTFQVGAGRSEIIVRPPGALMIQEFTGRTSETSSVCVTITIDGDTTLLSAFVGVSIKGTSGSGTGVGHTAITGMNRQTSFQDVKPGTYEIHFTDNDGKLSKVWERKVLHTGQRRDLWIASLVLRGRG